MSSNGGAPSAGESLYGLGQRQEGKLDIKGYDLDLWQRNTVVEIPFLVSSNGYGILWDNTSFTKFGDTRPFEPVPGLNLADAHTPAGALGEIAAPVTGDYQFQTYSNLDIKVWLDGELRIDHWKQNWATENDQFKVHLEAGKRYPIKIASSAGRDAARDVEDAASHARHLALVRSGRGGRLLLRLWPRAGSSGRRLPHADRAGVDAAQLGLRLLAVEEQVQHPGRGAEDAGGVPPPPDSDRQHRAGLAVLEARFVGHARVRGVALSGSRRDDSRDPRQPRALHDFGLGQVLSADRELESAGRDQRPLPADAHRRHEGLAQSQLRLLRRLQRAGPHALLGSGEQGALHERRRRLVDGRHRARPRRSRRRRRSKRCAATSTRPRSARPRG